MSEPRINQLVARLAGVDSLKPEDFGEALGTTLTPVDENLSWSFYKFDLGQPPFVGGELRVSKSGERALLILTAPEDPPILEKDLDLAQWGELQGIDVNPRIPPEGTDAYIYDIEAVRLSFQWTHSSRRLRTVVLEWG